MLKLFLLRPSNGLKMDFFVLHTVTRDERSNEFEMITNETAKRRVRVRIPMEFDYDEGHLVLSLHHTPHLGVLV